MSDIDFPSLIEPVARHFWGEPPKGLITGIGMRFGSQGSKSIVFKTGEWYDHEQHDGGGVLKLIIREVEHVSTEADAVRWLEDNYFIAATERAQERRSEPPAQEAPPDDDRPPQGSADDEREVEIEHYDYTDAAGGFQYRVIRYHKLDANGAPILGKHGNPKKTFRQKSRDASGNISWGLNGRQVCLYHWPALQLAVEEHKAVFICEGEKDVHTVEGWGLVATTNSGGAANWRADFAETFRGADVVILGDDDEAGRKRTEDIAVTLRGNAARIRVIGSWGGPKDVTDWCDKAGGTAEQLLQIVQGLPDWRPAPPAPKFGARRGQDIAGSRIVYDWLVKGLIERGGVFIVAGEKQAGKSFFVLDLAMKITLGLEYGKGDKARKVKQGAVIYLACEDRKGVDMRYEGYRRDNNISADRDVPFVIMGGAGGEKFSLLSDESVDAFIAHCLEWKAFYGSLEMVVIDTFSVATEGLDEIHSGEVGKVLGRVNRIADKTGATVCLVHHMNGEGSRVRGHSSLTANVSQVIEIRNLTKPQMNKRQLPEVIRDADNRIIHQAILEKNKNGPNRIKWRFVLRQVKLGVDEDGFEITTCVLDTPSSEPDDGQVKTGRLSHPQRLVYDAAKAAIEDHGKPIPGGTRAGSGVRLCVDQKQFVAAVRKVMEFRAPAEDQEARNREQSDFMARNVLALINGGYMGRDNDHSIIWLTGKDDRPKPDPKPVEKPQPSPLMTAEDMQVPF